MFWTGRLRDVNASFDMTMLINGSGKYNQLSKYFEASISKLSTLCISRLSMI